MKVILFAERFEYLMNADEFVMKFSLTEDGIKEFPLKLHTFWCQYKFNQ